MNARIEAIGDQVQKSDPPITYLSVSYLKELPNNPRTHTKAQIRKIANGEENLLAMHPTVKPVALVPDALLDCRQAFTPAAHDDWDSAFNEEGSTAKTIRSALYAN